MCEDARVKHPDRVHLVDVKPRGPNILRRALVGAEALQRPHLDLHLGLIREEQS